MRILRELWTKEVNDPDVCTTYQNVLDLKTPLESTCQIAQVNLIKSVQKCCVNYNKSARKET